MDRLRTKSVSHTLGALHLLTPSLHSLSFFALIVASSCLWTASPRPAGFLVLSVNGERLKEAEGGEGSPTALGRQSPAQLQQSLSSGNMCPLYSPRGGDTPVFGGSG